MTAPAPHSQRDQIEAEAEINSDMLIPHERCQPGTEQVPTTWPSREVIAREIRRAMLDNPTDDSFNKRAEKREIIADEAAAVILARFDAALRSLVEELTKALTDVRKELWVDYCLAENRTDANPGPFKARPHIRIIERALAMSLEDRKHG